MCWDKVYLVGGGPSLRGFNFELLRGQVVVAINDASRYLSWATALFSADLAWMDNRRSHIETFPGRRYLAIPPGVSPAFSNVEYLIRLRLVGLSSIPGTVHFGGTSGYAALNFAVLQGAKTVVLLGYDYSGTDRWYPDYVWSSGGRGQSEHEEWASNFCSMLPMLAFTRTQVLNASPQSRIGAFPKIELSTVTEGLEVQP